MAQNGLDIVAFTSPLSSMDYNTNSTVDVSLIIRNDGPNFIVNTDTFYVDLSIANPDTTEFYSFEIPSAAFFNVDDVKEYTLLTNYTFKERRSYRICASILGSKSFPSNLTKNANRCVTVFNNLNQNGMDIQAITSPQPNVNYDSNATVNVSATVLNEGPNIIDDTDTLYVNLNISGSDSTESYNLAIPAQDSLKVGEVKEYILFQDYTFSKEQNYRLCATLTGTRVFQTNSTANPTKCVSVVVGIKELEVLSRPSKVRYLNQKILFSSNSNSTVLIQIFNISGKLMTQETLKLSRENSLHFNAPSKGLYFMRTSLPSGESSTSKFAVH
jgi:hypothetical protein